MKQVKVMIVDDSAFVRQTLAAVLSTDPEIEVVSTAVDPIFAAKKIQKDLPDVITLDVEMPRMNGLSFLRKLMEVYPIPVIIISSLTEKSNELSLKALEYGAVDVITKPKLATREFFEESRIMLCDTVKAAAQARVKKPTVPAEPQKASPKLSADTILELNRHAVTLKSTTDKIVAVGASTGGTVALQEFLMAMPPDGPGIVIVQHMPEGFTRSFAERLDKICRITVQEGKQGDCATPGKAIIAPGNHHMLVNRSGARYIVEIRQGPLINRHRPSVDVLFRSVANAAGANAVGVIMTGMGDDGARGLLEMKQSGAYTIAQDESTSVVFGMPKMAIQMGAACAVQPIGRIANAVSQHFFQTQANGY